MSLDKLARMTYRMARAERAVRSPGRYAKNRAKSHMLRGIGFWKLWRAFWRL